MQKKNTFGALDLGGASTQYAFAVKKGMNTDFSNITEMDLFGHKYFVSSESFLCFGYYEAMNRMESIMLMVTFSFTSFKVTLFF